ncbi:MAG: cation:proton antiporter, partial [Archaeoglobaceae archaeon]
MENYLLFTITLGFSALVALLFRRLGFSQVTGYLIAGIFLGFIFQDEFQKNEGLLTIFSEIAIALLVFEIGREIGLKNIKNLSFLPLAILVFEIATSLVIALFVGNIFNLKTSEIIVLALLGSFSSTPVIFKILKDLRLGEDVNRLILTVAIMDDILAILALILLPQLAIGDINISQFIQTFFLSITFAVILIFLGLVFLDKFFRRVIKPDDDIGIAIAISFALLFAALSKYLGFSPALGAFCAGIALSEHPKSSEVGQNIKSIREIFLILFSVALGLEAGLLIEFSPILLLAPAMIVFGRFITFTASNWFLSNRSLAECIRIGFVATSVGEFGLVVVYEALRLEIVGKDFLSIAAISIILGTILASKLSFRSDYAEKLASLIPLEVKVFIDNISSSIVKILEGKEGEFVKELVIRIFRNVIAVIIFSILGSTLLYILEIFSPNLKNILAILTLAMIFAVTIAISIKTRDHAEKLCCLLVEKRGMNPVMERMLTSLTFIFIM